MLAQKGQGNFAVAADERGAEMLLADQLARTSLTVADGVFITTDFNPALVKKYRLIGYDNKKNISEDPTFRLEGSQIGSGHSLRALFELIPKKDTTGADTIAGVKINYRLPGKNSDKMMSYYCTDQVIPFDRADGSLKRSVCIAMLGMKLRKSAYAAQISWADLEKMAKKNFTGNDCMDREYLTLLAKAKKIYAPGKQAE
jgi:Ca-activated chloride channel homolog